ncbi:MAG: hypothetical protein C0501_12595 [Isosphaera sp.]|nr:hypothetical protein [Isosphaera sp.]
MRNSSTRFPRFAVIATLALISVGWATTDVQAGPLRYRGPQDRWHGSYYSAPVYGGHYSAPAYGGVYSYPGTTYSVAPVVPQSYYYAPSFAPRVYPAGGYYYGSGYGGYYGGGHYVPHHHHPHH